jgi:uncharacterized alpha-E superfamily protein
MISRVADHCFWFGRYIERAESTARVLAITSAGALDGELPSRAVWSPVIIVAGEEDSFVARFGEGGADDGEFVQRYMTWDQDNYSCIRRSIAFARENARSIREVVSLEAWETVNEIYLWLESPAARVAYEQERHGFYRRIRQAAQLCLGLLRSTMLHDEPLDFIWLGVLLERVGQTARILDVQHHAHAALPEHHRVVDTALWLALLRACSGFEPFMKRHRGHVRGHDVAAFLLLEPKFPRSVRYCVVSAHERFMAIRQRGTDPNLPGALTEARLTALRTWIEAHETRGRFDNIHDDLTHVVTQVDEACASLGTEMFFYQPTTSAAAPAPAPVPPEP